MPPRWKMAHSVFISIMFCLWQVCTRNIDAGLMLNCFGSLWSMTSIFWYKKLADPNLRTILYLGTLKEGWIFFRGSFCVVFRDFFVGSAFCCFSCFSLLLYDSPAFVVFVIVLISVLLCGCSSLSYFSCFLCLCCFSCFSFAFIASLWCLMLSCFFT